MVQAYYDALSDWEDHEMAYDAVFAAYCISTNASPADIATRTMFSVMIADAGVQGGERKRIF